MSDSVAQVSYRLVPQVDGRDLDRAADEIAGGLSTGVGSRSGILGNVGRTAGVAMLGGVGAAFAGGAVLQSIGGGFDQAFDTIRTGTGATGEALRGLETEFRDVFGSVPTSTGDAATAIADLNTRLGLTGDPLEDLSRQFINLSRITGTDLAGNIETLTRTFGDWGIDDHAGALDEMFRASQATGIGIDRLGAQVVQFGAPLRSMGFGFEESIGLLAKFEKEGVNSELVMGSMRIALGEFAREGENAPQALGRLIDEIKGMEDPTAAAARAMEVFGARAGPDMAAAIREGRFDLGDLLDTIENGGDTINGVAAETDDWREKLNVLMNRGMLALEPIAERVFSGLTSAVEAVMPFLSGLMDAFGDEGIGGALRYVGDAWSAAWPGIRERLGEMAAAFWQWVQDAVPPMLEKLGELLAALGRWLVDTALPWLGERLVEWGKAFVEWVGEAVPPLLDELGVLLSDLGKWLLDEGLPTLVENLAKWGAEFVKWVAPQIPPLIAELAKLLARMGEWIIVDALPFILSKLGEWALAYYKWVLTDALPNLLAKLGELGGAVVGWIGAKAGDLAGALGKWVLEFVTWPYRAVWDMATNLERLATGILSWVGGLPGRIANAARGMWDGIYESFRSAVNAIIDGWNRLSFTIGGGSYDPLGRFGPSVTVPAFTFNTPNIPRWARGGLATSLGLVGEEPGNPELVVPLGAHRRGDRDRVLDQYGHLLGDGAGMGGFRVDNLVVNIAGVWDMTDPRAAREIAARIRRELLKLEGAQS